MTAGPATPDHPHNSPRFRLIQLLPTFCDRSPGIWTERHFTSPCYINAVRLPLMRPLNRHKTKRLGPLIAKHSNRQCRHLHKICSLAASNGTQKRKHRVNHRLPTDLPHADVALHPPRAYKISVTNVTPRTCHRLRIDVTLLICRQPKTYLGKLARWGRLLVR